VHVTGAGLLAGDPLVNVDGETCAAASLLALPYCSISNQALAEQLVRDATCDGLETVCVPPSLRRGAGDTTSCLSASTRCRARRFAWIGGGVTSPPRAC